MNQPGVKPEPRPEIPEKLYFRIGEASRLVGVQPYVLRYWESEFPALAPSKSGTGHRFYRRKDVELLLQIKQLLYEKRYTIEGARRHLEVLAKTSRRDHASKTEKRDHPAQRDLFSAGPADWQAIRTELAAILDLLK